MKPRPGFREEIGALAAGCPGLNSRALARRMTQHFDAALSGSGLNLAQLGLLSLIATSEDDRMAALAARAGLDPSTLSRNLRGLERDGLIEIATVETDLRRRAVWPTEDGLRRLQAALPAWRAAQEQVEKAVPAAPLLQITAASVALDSGEG